jgi:hypothetical protein
VGGRPATDTIIDPCIGADVAVTASVNCATTMANREIFIPTTVAVGLGQGFTVGHNPTGGPNGDIWYVASASAKMDLRSNIKRDWRLSDGDQHPILGVDSLVAHCGSGPRNVADANRCREGEFATNFASMISTMWSHEGRHIDTAVTAAREAAYDVYRLWEPLKADDSVALVLAVSGEYTGARDAVFARSAKLDSAPYIAYSPIYRFCDYVLFAGSFQWTIRDSVRVATIRTEGNLSDLKLACTICAMLAPLWASQPTARPDSDAVRIAAAIRSTGNLSAAKLLLRDVDKSRSAASRDIVADSIVSIVLSTDEKSPNYGAAGNALTTLILAGAGPRWAAKGTPYAGAAARLLRIAESSASIARRGTAVFGLAQMADTVTARAMLRSIAISNNPVAGSAIGFLHTSMGPAGIEVLHELYRDSLVTERSARSDLALLARKYSWR